MIKCRFSQRIISKPTITIQKWKPRGKTNEAVIPYNIIEHGKQIAGESKCTLCPILMANVKLWGEYCTKGETVGSEQQKR